MRQPHAANAKFQHCWIFKRICVWPRTTGHSHVNSSVGVHSSDLEKIVRHPHVATGNMEWQPNPLDYYYTSV